MPITDILETNARNFTDEVCLVEITPPEEKKREVTWKDYELVEPERVPFSRRREMTWRHFDEAANRFANLLLERGIKRGEKVAVLLMNSLEWLPIYFGALRAGAIVVPLNYRYTADEIKYCLELAEVDALLFGPEFIGRVELICDQIPRVRERFYVGSGCPSFAESYHEQVAYVSCDNPHIAITDADDAAIYFSSGTTGFPKAILHTHESLMSSCRTEQNHHHQQHDDVFLCIPPLYHTGAKMHWFGSFLVGSKAVLLRGVKPQWIVQAVSEEKVSIVWLLVPWAQDILDSIERGEIDLSRYDLSHWRLMHIGAQPVPPSLVRRWLQVFPHHDYDTNYGLSESIGPGCVHLGIGNINKVGAIGKPGFGWQAKIVDPSANEVARGEIGELIVKGPGVMKCYYRDAKATAEVLKEGWLFTGDMARCDEDGFIFLVDRKKDVIITGGENLYPVQIEDFLRAFPAIKDVAVIGLADKRLGEIAAAIIEVKPGFETSEVEIQKFCEALPRYKRPRRIIFDSVPRNPTGKIEKPALRKKFQAESLVKTQTEE
ncbi:MAG: class I adenylate-forming enzyme family protein [Planctomycetia bacterium]|nr:class I adenylate-forming enzyme family protein [Planctomycetia bacterium]